MDEANLSRYVKKIQHAATTCTGYACDVLAVVHPGSHHSSVHDGSVGVAVCLPADHEPTLAVAATLLPRAQHHTAPYHHHLQCGRVLIDLSNGVEDVAMEVPS